MLVIGDSLSVDVLTCAPMSTSQVVSGGWIVMRKLTLIPIVVFEPHVCCYYWHLIRLFYPDLA